MTKTNDPGLGSNFDAQPRRLLNRDGSYNIRRIGGLTGIRDIYKFLLDLSWPAFIGLSFVTYLFLNVLFAIAYLLVGIDELSGTDPAHSDFLNAFFFSVQTLTTIGYGHIAPNGLSANLVAVVESFAGLMSIALITGLLYGRFSKPSGKIAFSKNIILTSHNGTPSVMFKIVNQRNSTLLNAHVKVMLIMDSPDDPDGNRKEYHRLPLEFDTIHFFPLTWTIVHEINEESPLYSVSLAEMRRRNCEIIALVQAFDDTHHQNVFERSSYAGDQWIENVRFVRNFKVDDTGMIELYVRDLDQWESL